jgi:spermidine synthase
VFELASRDRAPAFALLLSTYLAGIGAGSYVSNRLTRGKKPEGVLRVVATLLFFVGATVGFIPPLVAWLQWKGVYLFQIAPLEWQTQALNSWFLLAAPAVFLIAGAIGAVLPLLCESGIAAGASSGSDVSLTYAANIAGSTLGSLGIGFVWINRFGLQQVSEQLAALAIGAGLIVALRATSAKSFALKWAAPAAATAAACLLLSTLTYGHLFERLILGPGAVARGPFVHVVENRNGVIAVGRDGTVFGNAVYDGAFNIDPVHDVNVVLRAYSISLFHPHPKRMLMIGLSSGSWAQIMANHPDLESLDIVEINPGYLSLISQYPAVSSLLQNPKAHVTIDDARRWLISHPDARYDVIVSNTSFYWRDHSSVLLSEDFLEIVRRHLDPGGVYFYNTTTSEDVMATGLRVFPYGFRVNSFLALSDTPFDINADRWFSVLSRYQIDGKPVFDPANPGSAQTLARYAAMVQHLDSTSQVDAMETSAALNARLQHRLIITDANMGWEWRYP